jgi:eukaryotic-like serine/threonine-protein kinase
VVPVRIARTKQSNCFSLAAIFAPGGAVATCVCLVDALKSPTPMPLTAGDRLGCYEILAALGAGGMGEVYRAKDSRLGREVALKVLPDRFVETPDALRRFDRETRTLASLSHPNIVVLHDVGAQPTVPGGPPLAYAVMELLAGETLRERLSRALTWREAVDITASIADGLAAAHAKGIIHRDLKPENVFLTEDGRVKILDFGLAQGEPVQLTLATEASTITAFQSKVVEGTIGYMSPEQLQGKAVQTTSDLFSLGCCLYEMIGGRRPFRGDSAADVIAATLKGEAAPLETGPPIPDALRGTINRCIQKDPRERFHSAHDLAIALRDVKEGSVSGHQRLRRRSLGIALLVLIVAGVTAWAVFSKVVRHGAITSLAVLPFTAGGGPETEYLSEGLTETLINSLSQLPQIDVMSWSAVAQYGGRNENPLEAGRTLGVQAVLTGRVIQSSQNLRVSVALVDVNSARNIWGQKYNRRMDEIFVLQDDIAAEICDQLRLKLSSDQQKRLVRRFTNNTRAYQLYLQGRHHWRTRTPEGTKRAIALFEEAIASDPEYALAWSGLADAWVIGELPVTTQEAGNRARAAALNAVRLDDALPESHVSLSRIRFVYDRDWAGAENQARKALDRNPEHAEAHRWYSVMLTRLGRMNEAEREIHRALDLDPLNANNQQTLASFLYWAGRASEAEHEFRKILELDRNSGPAHAGLGLIEAGKGQHEQAISESRKGVDLAPNNLGVLSDLGYVYAVAGRRDDARKIIQELLRQTSKRSISSHYIGCIYAGLGEKDHAIEWLEKAYRENSQWLPHVKLDPQLKVLRGDPRFEDLLRRIGF